MISQAIGLGANETWAAVISLCTVGLIYFGMDVIHEFAEDPEVVRRENGKIVAPRQPATWASHPLCFAASALGVAAALQSLL